MKKYLVFLVIGCFALSFAADTGMSKDRLSLDFGGPIALATFEYQHVMMSKNKHSFLLTAGAGTTFLTVSLPVGVLYTYGEKNQLIAGIQYVPTLVSFGMLSDLFGDNSPILATNIISPRLGFRKLIFGHDETFYIQAYLSPLIAINTGSFLVWGGLGIGMSL